MKNSEQLNQMVSDALTGNQSALDQLLRVIQPEVYRLCLRFLMSPDEAKDATQDILLKTVLRLGQFERNSSIKTWVYRIATNHLLDRRKTRHTRLMSLDDFSEDLHSGLAQDDSASAYDDKLLAELRVGCTLALLQCVKPAMRITYILGEILELEQLEAASILELSAETYRQRLSRARRTVIAFMTKNCGLVNTNNQCRCHKRVATAQKLKRVDPENLIFVSPQTTIKRFPEVLKSIRKLEEAQRVSALFRAQNIPVNDDNFSHWLKSVIAQHH